MKMKEARLLATALLDADFQATTLERERDKTTGLAVYSVYTNADRAAVESACLVYELDSPDVRECCTYHRRFYHYYRAF